MHKPITGKEVEQLSEMFDSPEGSFSPPSANGVQCRFTVILVILRCSVRESVKYSSVRCAVIREKVFGLRCRCRCIYEREKVFGLRCRCIYEREKVFNMSKCHLPRSYIVEGRVGGGRNLNRVYFILQD